MVLEAVTKSIQDILSAQKKYIIPRFQREYSWEKEELTQLWEDIWACIKYESKTFKVGEYFIGSVVLSGTDQEEELEVVDGQQRLTTLTIMLSALRAAFEELGLEKVAEGTYAYIEGQDKDGEDFFKIVNSMVQPYFNDCVLYKNPKDGEPTNDEERRLRYAYNFFRNKLKIEEIEKIFENGGEVEHSDLLKAIRDQVLGFKLIYITVSEKKYANTIFETLNAKGKELTPVDLIKNEIFSVLDAEHPSDEARIKWVSIKEKLNSRSRGTSIPDYFRYYWISKYKYIAQNKIYSEFMKYLSNGDITAGGYLNDIERESDIYVKMYSPKVDDWTQIEERYIYDTLKSFNTFKVKSPRIFVLALFANKHVSHKSKKEVLKFLEDFHFCFTAIASSKASGIDRKYSKYAIMMRNSGSQREVNETISELKEDFKSMLPSLETFKSGMENIFYFKKKDKYKWIVKYILSRYEMLLLDNDEFDMKAMSIEHISDESIGLDGTGKIGNLLPLSQELNSKISNIKEFDKKVVKYEESNYLTVKEFCDQYGSYGVYSSDEINARTNKIAEFLYQKISENI